MKSSNSTGAYLVRCNNGRLTLSVRNHKLVKHYRIFCPDSKAFFLTQRVQFPSLEGLIAHYSFNVEGLCTVLIQPCRDEDIDEWEIDTKQIRLLRKLGAGQFWEVWEGLWNSTTSVAVKTLKPGTMSASEFLQEAELMKKLRHPKLIQLYGVCTKEEPISVTTELMKYGSLLEYLQGEGRSLKLPQLIDVLAQVASGMAYLEEQNSIHRDLAARNILVGENLICSVADFRLARILDEDEDFYESPAGTKFPIKWTAPEVALYNRFTIKSDVWSFGIVIYEVIQYGRLPYPGMTNNQVLEALQQGYRMPQHPNCPDKLYNIMLDCWKEDPASRPTFETLQWQLDEFFTTEDGGYYMSLIPCNDMV